VGELVVVADGDGVGVMVGVLVDGSDGIAVRVGGSVDVADLIGVGVEEGMISRSGARATAISPRQ